MRACTEERSTLPAVLTDAGYQTCAKGKMHFEPARAHYGFEHMKLPLDYMREYDKKQVLAHPKALSLIHISEETYHHSTC